MMRWLCLVVLVGCGGPSRAREPAEDPHAHYPPPVAALRAELRAIGEPTTPPQVVAACERAPTIRQLAGEIARLPPPPEPWREWTDTVHALVRESDVVVAECHETPRVADLGRISDLVDVVSTYYEAVE